MSENFFSSNRKWVAFGLLVGLIFLIYGNTFSAAWHLDDHPNITRNNRLHLTDLSYDAVLGSLFASPETHKAGKLYRPVASVTFALNWYFGREHVAGYHLVNISIHLLTAFFLYLTAMVLLATPNLKRKYEGQENGIALLAAVLWAVNPIQTQAVTYIVQRMTSMAAMFYLLGIYFYVKGRINPSPPKRGLLFAACIVSYVLAIGSKENAAILPLTLLLVEIVFFQNPGQPETLKRIVWCAVGGGLFVFLTGTLFFLKGDFLSFINGYGVRPFTLMERLLTESRIIVIYLSQIFLPMPQRLSFAHDVSVSTSLANPWTTLPAILFVIGLIGVGIWQIQKRPILAFAILFYFLNHLIESTVIPLELFFEHRNYLPSLFLFFPIAAGLSRLLTYAARRQRLLQLALISLTILLVMGMGVGTYGRNMAWATEKSLWEDVLQKAPGIARPYLVLAGDYESKGQYQTALALYAKSLALPDQRPKQSRGAAYNNMGTIYFNAQDYETAIDFYQKALKIRPAHAAYVHNLTLALVRSRKWPQASEAADLLITKYSFNPDYINLKSFILLKQNKPYEAISYLKRALSYAPHHRNALVNLGVAFSLAGKNGQSERILRRVYEKYPGDITILMCLIENRSRAEDTPGLNRYAGKLMSLFSAGEIKSFLRELAEGRIDVPLSPKLLAPAIAAKLKLELSVSNFEK